MPQHDIDKILDQLLSLPGETEWVEFKTADRNIGLNDLGKYFSALSNEANLHGKQCGWLVLGVDPKLNISGTNYRPHRPSLDSLKHEIAIQTSEGLSFIEIHEHFRNKRRVVLFEIPPALPNIPTKWAGIPYGRNGESLAVLNQYKIDMIRQQSAINDWSANICEGALLDVLDPQAFKQARKLYKGKHTNLIDEVDRWDDTEFLNRAGLTIRGGITNAAIVLLGKPESAALLSPQVAQVSWILKDVHGVEQDYTHFGPPLLMQVDDVFSKLRNLTIRQLPDGTLFPREIKQYDPWVVREALHNCIAHQDYSMNERISVVEKPDEIVFDNSGSFIPGDVKSLLEADTPPNYYRNKFLSDAMVELNMIDTVGSGIRRMFREQQRRYLPLPDYDLSDLNKVTVRITGRILDENYTKLLLKHENLDMHTVIPLDKVQKGLKLSKDEHRKLKTQGLVEGRFPNIFISSGLAVATKRKAEYIKNRPFDDSYYKKLILSFIMKYGSASRSEIDKLVVNKLSDALDEKQKKKKVGNLLQAMSKQDRTIINVGSRIIPKWILVGSNGNHQDS